MEWSDDETTELQFAVDAGDAEDVRRRLAPHSAEEVSGLQFYGNSTAFMYALQRSTPEVARAFIEKGVTAFELPWSDNNELKSAVGNPKHAVAMMEMVLEMLPDSLALDMITSDWSPEGDPEDKASAFELAERSADPRCKKLLLDALDRLRGR